MCLVIHAVIVFSNEVRSAPALVAAEIVVEDGVVDLEEVHLAHVGEGAGAAGPKLELPIRYHRELGLIAAACETS